MAGLRSRRLAGDTGNTPSELAIVFTSFRLCLLRLGTLTHTKNSLGLSRFILICHKAYTQKVAAGHGLLYRSYKACKG